MALDDPLFEDALRSRLAMAPHTRLVALPELHLHPGRRGKRLADLAEPIPGPRTRVLADLAARLGVWLLPGSLYERGEDGAVYNTAVAMAPDGTLAATYRKCFPWRPFELTSPGTRFVTFDIAGIGRVGLSICYDTWFPEVARHLAWMGADVIMQLTCTYTADREQELVLARATAIMNQVFVVNVNTAGPHGAGRSLVVDPEGRVRAQAGELAAALPDVLDLAEVARVRTFGTAGVDRIWSHFRPDDPVVPLPLYQGRIDPGRWKPGSMASQLPKSPDHAAATADSKSRPSARTEPSAVTRSPS